MRNRGIYISVDGAQFSPLVKANLLKDQYERLEFGILNATLNPSDVVMEIGGGLGFISIFAAQRAGSERVHAYEANPSLIPLIKNNYALNGVQPELQNCVLENSEGGGSRSFYLVEDFWASSTLDVSEETSEIKVSTVPFGDELARVQPTYLVVDIEGGEKELLTQVRMQGLRCALIEMHPTIIGGVAISKIIENLLANGLVENKKISTDDVLFFEKAGSV